MLQHESLQAVWVSSSTNVHGSQTLEAIEKGLHVLCEKPLSTDIDEVRQFLLPVFLLLIYYPMEYLALILTSA